MLREVCLAVALQSALQASCSEEHRGGVVRRAWSNATTASSAYTQIPSSPSGLILPPELSSAALSLPPSQHPSGTAPWIGSTTSNFTRSNASDPCGRCTINVRNAGISWFMEPTYVFPVFFSTIWPDPSNYYNKSISPLPTTTTINPPDLLNNQEAFATNYSFYGFPYLYTLTPAALTTTVVTRTATLPISGYIPHYEFDEYTTRPEPASVSVAASLTPFLVPSATPFAVFSEYEIVRPSNVAASGSAGRCQTATIRSMLDAPYAFAYSRNLTETDVREEGTVPSDFLHHIGEDACEPGKFYGDVTVIMVVDISYQLQGPGAAADTSHLEVTVEAGWGLGVGKPVSVPAEPTTKVVSVRTKFPVWVVHKETTKASGDWGAEPTQDANSNTGLTDSQRPDSSDSTPNSGGPNAQQLPDSPDNSNQANQIGGPGVVVEQVPIVIGGQTAVGENLPGNTPVVIVGRQTAIAGGPAITIGDTAVSLAPSATAIVIGGATSQLVLGTPAAVPTPPPVLTVGGSRIIGNAATQYFFGPGQILTPGGTVVVAGTTISLDRSAGFAVIGGSTAPLAPGPTPAATLRIAGVTVKQQPGGAFVVDQNTLLPGRQVVIAGTTVSLGPSAAYAVINGQTTVLAPAAAITPSPPLTINGNVYSVRPGSGTTYMIGGQALTPGGLITVAGRTISLLPSATAYVVDGTTTSLSGPSAQITNAPILTINGQTLTASDGTTYIYKGQILTPGGVIIVDGETISLAESATQLIVNGQTTTLFPATTIDGPARTGPNPQTAVQTGDVAEPTNTGDSATLDISLLCLTAGMIATLTGAFMFL